MNRILLIGIIFSLFGNGGLAVHSLRISSETVEASDLILESKAPCPEPLRLNKGYSLSDQFQIPRGKPCFLILETRSNLAGRLNLHLEPTRLPADLERTHLQQESPVNNPSFQVVVDTEPGDWRIHTLDLAADFFETVTPRTYPYDPAGTTIQKIRFEVAEPSRPGLEISVRGLKIVKLTGEAMKTDLAGRSDTLRRRLDLLQKESSLRKHWTPKILNQIGKAEGIGENAESWRQVALALERLHLQSGKWSLENLPDQTYAVGTASSLRRISGNHPRFGFKGIPGAGVQLLAGKNEYESFQLVILPLTRSLTDIKIEPGDLVSDDGTRTIAADNFEVFQQIEQFVQPSRGTAYDWAGWLPDALQPVNNSIKLKASETTPLWVTIFVPAGTVAGTYTGKIRITAEGESETMVSVKAQIHEFSIPKVGRFRTQGHLHLEGLKAWYRDHYSAEVRKNFYRLLLKYRQSPTSQYSPRLSPDSEDIPWIMREGGNVVLIGGFSGQDLDSEIIDPAYNWLVENDYIDQAIIYVGDETDDFDKMKAKARTIRRNWPRLRIMIGGSKPREELIGYFDVWDPITHGGDVYNFDPESAKKAVDRGEEMFWYTCVGPRSPYANVYNDHPLTATRALWWQAWKYEVTGFEYWWFNYWNANIALSEGNSPWPASRLRDWNSRSFKWSNGDGVLVYPGSAGEALASIRLSVMRDAIEDWEVLFMLQRAVELTRRSNLSAAKKYLAPAESILSVPEEITSSLTEWNQQPEVYFGAREKAYELLSSLRSIIGGEEIDQYTASWVKKHQSWLQKKFEQRVAATR